MNLPELAVRRKTTFLMIFILMVGMGFFGYSLLGLDYFPEMSLDKLVIMTGFPGAGPEEIESLVSSKIEDAVALVSGIDHIESTSSSNLSVVTAEFVSGTDIDQAEIDIRNAISSAREELPEDILEPMILAMDPSMSPVMVVGVSSSTMNDVDLKRLVQDNLKPLLTRVDGVASISVSGGLERQINVHAEPVLMERHGISISQIAASLEPVRNNIPAGRMDSGGLNYVLNVEAAFHNIAEIENLVVGHHDGVPVHLGDVCTIEDGTEEKVETTMVDGERAVLMMVYRRTGANTVEACNNVKSTLQDIETMYGQRLTTSVVYDQSTSIENSVKNVSSTGVMSVIIAVLVLFFFLGSWKTSGTVALSIPLSIFLTFPVMALLNVSLNMISLAGIVLAIGLLVDNSIVVLENIFRHRTELKSSPRRASIDGAGEVAMAISSSTMTTLAVFIPIILIPGITGRLFRDFSLTISSTLLIALFVALTLIPLITSRMKESSVKEVKKGIAGKKDAFLEKLSAGYARSLKVALGKKKLVVGGAVFLFIVAMIVIQYIPSEFIPAMDDGLVMFIVYRSPGTELASTDSTMVQIIAELQERIPEEAQEHIYFTAGESEGIMAAAGGGGTNEANLIVKLVPSGERNMSKSEVEEIIRDVFSHYPDVEYSRNDPLFAALQGGQPIEISVFGDDVAELTLIGENLAFTLKQIDGIEEARSSLDEQVLQLSFVPSYDMMSLRAASPAMLGNEANLAFMGSDISVLREGSDEFDVNLRYPLEYRSSLSDLNSAVLAGLPLTSWGEIVEKAVPKAIIRRDQERVVTVTGTIAGRTIGEVGNDVTETLEGFNFEGNRYEVKGQMANQKTTFKGLIIALIISALLVYMVMASQFESLLEPFIIVITVPLAISGAIFMLALTGTSLSALSLVGFIMLVGIVVNNGIVFVDYANKLLNKGMNRFEAVIEAGRTRLRPILMTACTAIIAMIPMAIGGGEGGEIYAPMGRAVIGGLTVGTFLTLFVIPCLYIVFGRFKKAEETEDQITDGI